LLSFDLPFHFARQLHENLQPLGKVSKCPEALASGHVNINQLPVRTVALYVQKLTTLLFSLTQTIQVRQSQRSECKGVVLREHVVIRRSAEGAHQSSSLLRYIKSADEHNGMLSNVLFGRGSDNSNACRATSHSGGVWKYCMSNVLFGRGSNHFNALFGRGFGEYVVTLVKLRNGCMRQACSAPDTSFVSLPAGGRNLQPTLSVDNAFEGKSQPSSPSR
jgi:hypothetical protein